MAFPQIVDADTQSGTVTSNSTSWTLTYPTNIAAGDLLLAFVASDGNPGETWPGSWKRLAKASGTGAAIILCGGVVAAGTESGNFTLTMSAGEQGGWRVFRITGWFGGMLPNESVHTADGFDALNVANGTNNLPNPPNLDPGGWATEDTLWIAGCGVDTSRTISVYPLPDRNTADVSGGSNGATLGLCTTESAVSALDPGTFTISAADDWGALTVAVRPAAAVAAGQVPYTNVMPPLLAQ